MIVKSIHLTEPFRASESKIKNRGHFKAKPHLNKFNFLFMLSFKMNNFDDLTRLFTPFSILDIIFKMFLLFLFHYYVWLKCLTFIVFFIYL